MGTTYWDADEGRFDPNKEWDSAADFIEMVNEQLLTILPEPDGGIAFPAYLP